MPPKGTVDSSFDMKSPLPVAKAPFNLLMRLYWPKREILDGAWTPPPVRRVG